MVPELLVRPGPHPHRPASTWAAETPCPPAAPIDGCPVPRPACLLPLHGARALPELCGPRGPRGSSSKSTGPALVPPFLSFCPSSLLSSAPGRPHRWSLPEEVPRAVWRGAALTVDGWQECGGVSSPTAPGGWAVLDKSLLAPPPSSHMCTHAHTHTHAEVSAHARHHGIRGDNGLRALTPDTCQSWGPRQTAGPPPRRAKTPPSCPPQQSIRVCLHLNRCRHGSGARRWGRSRQGKAAPVPSPPPTLHFPETSPGPPRLGRGPSGSLLSRELNTKRQLPVGRVGGQRPL